MAKREWVGGITNSHQQAQIYARNAREAGYTNVKIVPVPARQADGQKGWLKVFGTPPKRNPSPRHVIIRNAKSVSLTKLPGGGVKVRVVRKKRR